MGFGDKLKELREQAKESVASHSEQIHDAVDAAAVAANAKTRGRHAQRIAKFGQKASDAVDKFGGGADADAADATGGAGEDPGAAEPPAGGPGENPATADPPAGA